MGKSRTPGTWFAGFLFLFAVAAGAVGLHAWRERGAWLRTEPGKVHACVLMEGGDLTPQDTWILEVELAMATATPVPGSRRSPVWWTRTTGEPPTGFAPAYLQFVPNPDGPTPTGLDPGELLEPIRKHLPAPRGKVAGYRLAIVDPRGEVVRLESWPPPP